jgi:hypothetical protein
MSLTMWVASDYVPRVRRATPVSVPTFVGCERYPHEHCPGHRRRTGSMTTVSNETQLARIPAYAFAMAATLKGPHSCRCLDP